MKPKKSVNVSASDAHDPYAALRLREFRAFVVGRNLSGIGDQMQSVVIQWGLYERTGKALTLGYVGLVQALPIFLFALLAGHVADIFPRKRVAMLAQLGVSVGSVMLALLSAYRAPLPYFYVCLFCISTCRAFGNPARGALLPQIVPTPQLSSAISWDTSIRRIAVMSGAALGGWLLALTHHAANVFVITAILGVVSALMLSLLSDPPPPQTTREPVTWKTLVAGIAYIRHTNIILATVSLDLFAVLLGGATTLMPIYARDILRVGPDGLGWLRAAPSAGALVVALSLAHARPFRFPRQSHAVGRGRVRDCDYRFRPVALDAAFASGAFRRGRAGHGQRGRAADARADTHAGCDARARECGQQRVHQQFQ